jgi:hypothetical protein
MTLNITPGIMALSMTLKNATLSLHHGDSHYAICRYAERRYSNSDLKKVQNFLLKLRQFVT